MSELREHSTPEPENPIEKLIKAAADRIRTVLKGDWLDDMSINAILAGGLSALASLPLDELQKSQIKSLHQHRKELEAFFIKEGCGEEAAEDRADCCLFKIIEWISNGHLLFAPKAFAFKIARQVNEDANKSRKRCPNLAPEAASRLETHGSSPEEVAIRKAQAEQQKKNLEKLLNSLDEREKVVLRLAEEGKTAREAAEAMVCEEKEVKTLRTSIRRRARKFGLDVPRLRRRKKP